uniref:Bm8767, isoform d n=2 Tax=Brugia malayi TaxID=6279 RepID=A0A1I9G6K7_BRUMA|nr:Bm8767, isoform d [Brugia malayi]
MAPTTSTVQSASASLMMHFKNLVNSFNSFAKMALLAHVRHLIILQIAMIIHQNVFHWIIMQFHYNFKIPPHNSALIIMIKIMKLLQISKMILR